MTLWLIFSIHLLLIKYHWLAYRSINNKNNVENRRKERKFEIGRLEEDRGDEGGKTEKEVAQRTARKIKEIEIRKSNHW